MNSGGDNIAPGPIEQDLSLYPEIEQVVVVGDARPWLSAIICFADEVEATTHEQALRDVLKRYNQDKSPVLQIRKRVVMSEPCSMENGLLTPTHKIKRPQVIRLYQSQVDALHDQVSSKVTRVSWYFCFIFGSCFEIEATRDLFKVSVAWMHFVRWADCSPRHFSPAIRREKTADQ